MLFDLAGDKIGGSKFAFVTDKNEGLTYQELRNYIDDIAGQIDMTCIAIIIMNNDLGAVIRYGARFPDTGRYGDYDNRVFSRMTLNPWWHGYFETNYIKATIYATRMADAIGTHGKGQQAKATSPNYYRERNDDAHTIARQMMAKYIGKDPLDATDLILPEAPSDYNLPHFYWYMVPMTGAQVAIKCFSYSFTTK